jgi:Tfp pilus assembly protein PilN
MTVVELMIHVMLICYAKVLFACLFSPGDAAQKKTAQNTRSTLLPQEQAATDEENENQQRHHQDKDIYARSKERV